MIYYGKLLKLLEDNGINSYTIKKEKIIGQETYRKLKTGTGIYENGWDVNKKVVDEEGKVKSQRKIRINAIDTKAIETLCVRFNCTPNDIMEVIPNTEENSDRLCEILKCTKGELPSRVPMEN